MKRLFLFIALCVLFACDTATAPAPPDGPAYFSVSFAPGTATGTAAEPLPPTDEYRFTIAVEARGIWGERRDDYTGEVALSLIAAELRSEKRLKLERGVVGPLAVRFGPAYGVERIAVQELAADTVRIGARDIRLTGRPVGVSDPIQLGYPRIPSVQAIHSGNPFYGFPSLLERRNLTIRGRYDTATGRHRDMVVLAVIEGGFYLADPDCADHCAIYLYTYSTPYVEDGDERGVLQPGTLIEEVNGSVFEFFGFTELSFPTFRPRRDESGRIVKAPSVIPAPRDITACIDDGDDYCLEAAESSIVTIAAVTVTDFDETEEGWTEYGQFPLVTRRGGVIMAQTAATAPGFDPRAMKGIELRALTGILKQHTSARPATYIVVPRDGNDIALQQESP